MFASSVQGYSSISGNEDNDFNIFSRLTIVNNGRHDKEMISHSGIDHMTPGLHSGLTPVVRTLKTAWSFFLT